MADEPLPTMTSPHGSRAAERIADYISGHLQANAGARSIEVETPLLEGGLIRSLQLLELVLFLEREFGVRVPAGDLLPEHFSTIGRILSLLRTLGAAV